jgi:hypothetical protein
MLHRHAPRVQRHGLERRLMASAQDRQHVTLEDTFQPGTLGRRVGLGAAVRGHVERLRGRQHLREDAVAGELRFAAQAAGEDQGQAPPFPAFLVAGKPVEPLGAADRRDRSFDQLGAAPGGVGVGREHRRRGLEEVRGRCLELLAAPRAAEEVEARVVDGPEVGMAERRAAHPRAETAEPYLVALRVAHEGVAVLGVGEEIAEASADDGVVLLALDLLATRQRHGIEALDHVDDLFRGADPDRHQGERHDPSAGSRHGSLLVTPGGHYHLYDYSRRRFRLMPVSAP